MAYVWTKDREDFLRQEWKNYSAKEIVKLIGGEPTRNAVIGKAARLGLSGQVKLHAKNVPGQRKKKKARNNNARRVVVDRSIVDERCFNAPIHLLKLDNYFRQCRTVIGDPINLMFCGEPTVHETSWCASCFKVMTLRPTGKSAKYRNWSKS